MDNRYENKEEARGPTSPLPNRPAGQHATSSRTTWVGVIACWLALAATIVCNVLFEHYRLGGVTTAGVSNQVFTWFAPAGYVFSIWGVIYAALLVWMVAETRRAVHGAALNARQASIFVVSCALNVGWLVAFRFQQVPIALVVIMALWLAIALLYVEFRDDGTRTMLNLAPFSLYHAWTTVAMVVNATNLATRMAPAPLLANQVSTVVLAAAVLVVAYLAVRNSRDFVFPLVILWATVGVGVHLMGVDMMVSTAVLVLSGIGAVVVYLPALLAANRAPNHLKPQVGED